jgi:hypothetical protein
VLNEGLAAFLGTAGAQEANFESSKMKAAIRDHEKQQEEENQCRDPSS